ncbi:TetR/AcrR family transcriptional regulator [Bacillus carboniphilus]|uniref:TetR/AcrR family transcriptional regulator n=1 Tax=Bacillus carboniphilus TaxID=86663 RepID=A0ABY9JUB1_9BACI|nr:TetR/AcrR family transcriptional regulator [Bacillus carboniphilus]WLR42015.1 TetR/AcrR family transcriptional regulator [Bacillus carboniphilus]
MSPKVSQEHKERRRAKILDAARNVFIKYGFEKATMKHIMEESSVSRGGLYQYFSNKEDVMKVVLEEELDVFSEKINATLSNQPSSYWKTLQELLLTSHDDNNEVLTDPLTPAKIEFHLTSKNDEQRLIFAKKRYKHFLNIYARIIKEGQQKGEFSSKYEAEVIAGSIISFTDGVYIGYDVLSKEVELKKQMNLFVDSLKFTLGVEH